MPLGADYRKSAGSLHLGRKLDVGASSGHIGGDGHRAGLSGAGHYLGLSGELLGVQQLGVSDPGPLHHSQEQFGSLHVGGAHQHRPSRLAELQHPLDHGVILGPLGLVDEILLIIPDHGLVGGYDHHVKLVYGPELSGLRLRRTGHSGQLMIHSEIVLKGDGGESLGGILHLHVLLGLHRLMQSVAPAPALHDSAGLLVHDLHLAVHYDVVHILLEHGIGLEQLDHRVHPLALDCEFLHQGILLLLLLGGSHFGLLDLGHPAADVGKDEEIVVVHAGGEQVMTLVGHVHGMLLLVYDEIQRVGDRRHFPLVVLKVIVLGFLHYHLYAGLAEILYERLILGQSLVAPEQELSAFGLVTGGQLGLGFVESAGDQRALQIVELLHIGSELHELVVGR